MIPYFQWTAVTIGPVHLYVWGTFVAIGIIVATWCAMRIAEQQGHSAEYVFDQAVWVVLWGLIGARVLYCVSEFAFFAAHPFQVFALWNGGMSITGGILGGVFYLVWSYRNNRLAGLQYLELVALVCPIGMCIGRVGCFCIYDHPGSATTLPWGQEYSDGVVRHNHGLYLSLHAGLIAVLFWFLYRRNPHRPAGTYIALFAVLYGAPRFFLDFLRATDIPGSDPRYAGLTIAQYVSLFMIVAGLFLWYTVYYGKASKKAPTS